MTNPDDAATDAASCTLCGKPGLLHAREGRMKILCRTCAAHIEYDLVGELVEELTPGMRGRWLVLTQGSGHVWDLDRMTYTRIPGQRSLAGPFAFDGEAHPIVTVTTWPRIGGYSHVVFDAGEPTVDQWRISSMIRRIERIG